MPEAWHCFSTLAKKGAPLPERHALHSIPLRRPRLLATVAATLAGLALGAPAASAAAVPDPLADGVHPTKKIDYEAGNLVLRLADGTSTTQVPLRGSITYPDDAVSAPIVLFDHGRHTACIGGPVDPAQRICDDTYDPDGTPIETDVRSYAGYDYMAKNLASHGYVVMSVETNTANFDNDWRDGGANARSQIIQANLELLYRWHKGAGPYVPGEPDHTVGTKLTGKLDWANPIGLMGHSRGGDAVTDFVGYTRNLRARSGFPRMNLGGVLALAPVNYSAFKMPYGVNYGMLLPACDGDVSTLQGGRFFENSKYPTDSSGQSTDTFAKVQWYVQGTNHNFYNTVWVNDDFGTAADPACNRATPGTARLTTRDQRRVGQALMNSFMRRYVGGEREFEPIMTGEMTLPPSGEPVESGKGAGQTVKTSYVAPLPARLDVLRPTAIPDPQPDPADPLTGTPSIADSTLTTRTAARGDLLTSGLTTFEVCNPNGPAYRQGPTFPVPYVNCPDNANNRSLGNQFTVIWDGPSFIDAGLGGAKDVSVFGALHLRAAVNRNDARNPVGDGANPQSATQDFEVTLVDAAGKRASTNAAAWTTSLQPSIGNRFRHIALNGIRIPLSAFKGINRREVVRVELGFGRLSERGSIQLADVMFQEAPKPIDPDPVDPVDPDPDLGPDPVDPDPVLPREPASIPPGPIVDAPPTAPVPGVCADTKKPVVKLTRLSSEAKKLWIRGVALDSSSCAAASGVAAGGVAGTLVEIYRPISGGKARFATAGGKLSKPLPLAEGIAIRAKGKGSWSVSVAKARLPSGRYRVRVSTYDRAGNIAKLGVRSLTIKK